MGAIFEIDEVGVDFGLFAKIPVSRSGHRLAVEHICPTVAYAPYSSAISNISHPENKQQTRMKNVIHEACHKHRGPNMADLFFPQKKNSPILQRKIPI